MENKIVSISFILAAVAILILSLTNPIGIGAQYYVPTVDKKDVLVDKKVRSVNENAYFDNISSSQKVFFEGDYVEYKIVVENSGNKVLNNIDITDTLPKYIELVLNPGVYNKDLNKIIWKIDKLDPGQRKEFLIRAKIIKNDIKEPLKLTNEVEVKADGVDDKDTASIFIGVKKIPVTGDNTLPLKSAIVVVGGLAGVFLRKLARGY